MFIAGDNHSVGIGQDTSLVFCCKRGDHKLDVVYETRENAGGECVVVRWCSVCGAVVVDTDVDGLTKKGDVMKMKMSLVAQNAFAELALRK